MLGGRARLAIASAVATMSGCILLTDLGGFAGGDATANGDAATPDSATDDEYGDGHDGDLDVSDTRAVNAYAALTLSATAGVMSVDVDDVTNLRAGDAILLLEPTILKPLPSADPTPIDLSAAGIGHHTLARIASVSGNTLQLVRPLEQAFRARAAQVVSVPEYRRLTIRGTGKIVAAPWNGVRGGVVALIARETVILDGAIDVDGTGAHGGPAFRNAGHEACNALDGTPGAGYAAKGEGILLRDPVADAGSAAGGRGNVGNGGGGGNCHNAGGGGGGNGGAGGSGGRACCFESGGQTGGIGGAKLVGSARGFLTFGGGGGAGDGEVNPPEELHPGGNGGGIVLVRARSIRGTGVISASGGDAAPSNGNGGPGGGAGGTIVAFVEETIECLAIRANGGNGGSNTSATGTGGGGGGGRVYVRARARQCPVEVRGAMEGRVVGGDARGATVGGDGISEAP